MTDGRVIPAKFPLRRRSSKIKMALWTKRFPKAEEPPGGLLEVRGFGSKSKITNSEGRVKPQSQPDLIIFGWT